MPRLCRGLVVANAMCGGPAAALFLRDLSLWPRGVVVSLVGGDDSDERARAVLFGLAQPLFEVFERRARRDIVDEQHSLSVLVELGAHISEVGVAGEVPEVDADLKRVVCAVPATASRRQV